ncbi:SMI1/KNR4 family protein [Clostridium botulinum]|uniref:SMI1/KNR4 family protein n=1 Tax=Clostridium sp. ZBS18 TaxID=2949967 RepID=UPI001DAF0B74|nr:SMI1/KNR4 family protein [Clostridium sp. ZBS18]MBN1055585.1 SMI1/KNR4 family protein [Clostridium botulinum]
MNLEEIENIEGIKFPRFFRDIYSTGAMKWMTSYKWLNENRKELLNTPAAFMYGVESDCEPLLFEDIQDRKEFIDEMNEISGYKIKEEYTFIPFAITGGGDIYCFIYKNKTELTHIILYKHDTDDIVSYGVNFEEFLMWQMSAAITEWEQEIDNCILAHAKYLKDEYKILFENRDIEAILKTAKEIEIKMDKLGKENLQSKFYNVID